MDVQTCGENGHLLLLCFWWSEDHEVGAYSLFASSLMVDKPKPILIPEPLSANIFFKDIYTPNESYHSIAQSRGGYHTRCYMASIRVPRLASHYLAQTQSQITSSMIY